MEKYIHVQSSDSDAYFSDNEVYRFKVHLSLPLTLRGFWKVALTEFYASHAEKVKHNIDFLYIYSDLCKESIVHGHEQPLLRRLSKNTDQGWIYNLESPYYLPIKKNEVREFQVFIKLGTGEFATDLIQPLHLTLHLKQYPFL